MSVAATRSVPPSRVEREPRKENRDQLKKIAVAAGVGAVATFVFPTLVVLSAIILAGLFIAMRKHKFVPIFVALGGIAFAISLIRK